MSLGRFHEIYKKNNNGEKYINTFLIQILSQEIKLLKRAEFAEPGCLFNPQDLTDFMSGVRELQLTIVDDAMVSQLISDTRFFLS